MTKEEDNTSAAFMKLLAEVLERLAASADVQEAYLAQLGVLPSVDELALELGDSLAAAKPHLDARMRGAVEALSQQLDQMSGSTNAELWTVAALRSAPAWERVRALARVATRVH